MKVAFVFGVAFTKYDNDFYSINLSNELLEDRYLCVFDSMVVVGRYKVSSDIPNDKLVKVNGNRIEMRCICQKPAFQRVIALGEEQRFIEASIKDCDYVICRGTWGARACRKLGKNYMIELVSCSWDAFWNHGILGKIIAPYMYLKTKKEVAKADRVLYVTNGFLQKRYPNAAKTIGISDVALQEFDETILKNRTVKINSYREGEKLILGTAAAIDVPYKGQRFVIRALSILKKKGMNCFEYQIVGNGSSEALLQCAKKYQVEDQVIIIGGLPHDQVFKWLDTIDIYIQPSLQEGLPRAMIEAMSRALPCIGTSTGGIPELVDKEFVCKNRIRISHQLARILCSLNKDKLLKAAMRNYIESKKYDTKLLSCKRREFLEEFRECEKKK